LEEKAKIALLKIYEKSDHSLESKLKAAYEIGWKMAVEEAVFNLRAMEIHDAADEVAKLKARIGYDTELH
jgi:hypothetical protein